MKELQLCSALVSDACLRKATTLTLCRPKVYFSFCLFGSREV